MNVEISDAAAQELLAGILTRHGGDHVDDPCALCELKDAILAAPAIAKQSSLDVD